MQDQRDDQAKRDLDGNGDQKQRRGSAHRLPEDRVGQDGGVVCEADELLLRHLGQVEVMQAFPDRIEQRRDAHDDQCRNRRA